MRPANPGTPVDATSSAGEQPGKAENASHRTGLLAVAAVAESAAFLAGFAGAAMLWRTGKAFIAGLPWFWESALGWLVWAVVPGLVGLSAAIWARRLILRPSAGGAAPSAWRQLYSQLPARRTISAAVLAGYAATFVLGVPAVLSDAATNDGQRAEATALYYGEPMQAVFTNSPFAVPLLPGVILFYHSHSGGRLHGWGGWKLYAWWGFGERQLAELPEYVT